MGKHRTNLNRTMSCRAKNNERQKVPFNSIITRFCKYMNLYKCRSPLITNPSASKYIHRCLFYKHNYVNLHLFDSRRISFDYWHGRASKSASRLINWLRDRINFKLISRSGGKSGGKIQLKNIPRLLNANAELRIIPDAIFHVLPPFFIVSFSLSVCHHTA